MGGHLPRLVGACRNPVAALVLGVHALVVFASLAGPALILASTVINENRFTLTAWRNTFADWNHWETLLVNTGAVAAVTLALACILGTALAALYSKTDVHGRLPGVILMLLAAAVPLYVMSGAAVSVVGLGSLRGSTAATGLIHAAAHLPVVAILIGMAFRSVPAAAEESALADGAGPLRVFFSITLSLGIGGPGAASPPSSASPTIRTRNANPTPLGR